MHVLRFLKGNEMRLFGVWGFWVRIEGLGLGGFGLLRIVGSWVLEFTYGCKLIFSTFGVLILGFGVPYFN